MARKPFFLVVMKHVVQARTDSLREARRVQRRLQNTNSSRYPVTIEKYLPGQFVGEV